MNKKWISTSHPVSDIKDWSSAGTLILAPDFQRREVWGAAARIMLIDSILNGIPLPKIFVSSVIRGARTVRSVIDGQQRLSAILDFIGDKFSLGEPYTGPYAGQCFSELPEQVRDEVILGYELDFNEAKGLGDAELRLVYSRVNKYLVPLNRQELRRADSPGVFQQTAEDLSGAEFLDESGMFSPSARRRSLDVEFVSELLAAVLHGATDGKDFVDQCYDRLSAWDATARDQALGEFNAVLGDLGRLFPPLTFPLKKTRWKQKADFYSLFLAILGLHREGYSLPEDTQALQHDLSVLDMEIAPTSAAPVLSEYAVYCVSQANSAASRRWRTRFMRSVLLGTYAGGLVDPDQQSHLAALARGLHSRAKPLSLAGIDAGLSGPCVVCSLPAGYLDEKGRSLIWDKDPIAVQFSNARIAHTTCARASSDLVFVEFES